MTDILIQNNISDTFYNNIKYNIYICFCFVEYIYIYISGVELSYSNWGVIGNDNIPDYPDTVGYTCMKIVKTSSDNFHWQDADCTEELPYICASGG